MNIGFGLNLQQTQKLVMTPELKQAIQLLQYSSIELNDYILTEMEVNPLLEFDKSKEKTEELSSEKTDIDWQEYAKSSDDNSYTNYSANEDREVTLENMIAEQETLMDYLIYQLMDYKLDKKEMEIGYFLIQSLDSNGYLTVTIEDIINAIEVDVELIEKMLYIVQSFEPVGVGCRNLKECLWLQVKRQGIEDPNIYTIIESHLENIANNKVSQVAKELELDTKQVQEYFDYIKTLQPKPGSGFNFSNEKVKFIQPDVELKEVDGKMIIIVKDSAAPHLIINDFYKKMLLDKSKKDASEFINQKLNSAAWLIRTIEQRRNTIYKVVEAIYKRQKDFFVEGQKALKPMTLRDIADEIEMHESTVSRTTSGKYVLTSKGTYELKYFFSSGFSKLSQDSNEEISAIKIKITLEEIIKSENTKKPLSDQKIVEELKKYGFNISRRTVAKYREELDIPASSKRKRFD